MNQVERQSPANNERQSIWSIRANWSSPYFMVFTVQVIAGEAVIMLNEITSKTQDSAYDTFVGIIQGVGWMGVASAVNTVAISELLEGLMVTAQWFRQKYLEPLKERQRQEGLEQGREEGLEQGIEQGIEQGLQRGRKEGRAELISQFKDWDARRRDAEARGESFDEPPPYYENGSV